MSKAADDVRGWRIRERVVNWGWHAGVSKAGIVSAGALAAGLLAKARHPGFAAFAKGFLQQATDGNVKLVVKKFQQTARFIALSKGFLQMGLS